MLSAPETAAGKKAKCPTCGQIMTVPEAVQDAEEIGASPSTPFSPLPSAESPQNWLDEMQGPEAAPATHGPSGEARRPCPECGEMIVAGAAKCRFCGAVFDPRLRRTSMNQGQSYQGFATTSMVLGILALPTFCFGIVFGIVAIIFAAIAKSGMNKSKNYEGKTMATAGMIMGVLGAIGWTLIYVLIFSFVMVNAPHHRFR